MEIKSFFPAVRLQYSGSPTFVATVDGTTIYNNTLPTLSSLQERRLTLPFLQLGSFAQYKFSVDDPSFQCQFEKIDSTNFTQQTLFHHYDIGFVGQITPKIYLDSTTVAQAQTYTSPSAAFIQNIRCYFNPLAYGYVPHIDNTNLNGEVLWARPIALPPRFFRGIRTHSEFQITFQGDVDIEWFLDGTSIGTYTFSSITNVTEKAYFPASTIGNVLQYSHTNPEVGGKIYTVETDVTLGDLEQQNMRPQVEEG